MQRLNTLAFLRGLADRFLPALFWMLVIFGFDAPSVGIITLIAAALHELGHITAIVLLGKRARAPSGRLNGLKIRVGSCGYKELFLILFAGPLANLFFALLLSPSPSNLLKPLPKTKLSMPKPFKICGIWVTLPN